MGALAPPQAPGPAGKMVRRNWVKDIQALFRTNPPKAIVDGGAHTGAFTTHFLRMFPGARIHAFEPIPELAKALRKKFPKRVAVHENALGAKNHKLKFNVLKYPGASSVLAPSALLKAYQKDKIKLRKVLDVKCCRLDNIISHADLIKLDLQGYELQALKGCGKLLSTTRALVTEVEFAALYDDQPLFADIDLYLRKYDFRLFNLYDLWTHPQGQITAGNAIFLNRRFYA